VFAFNEDQMDVPAFGPAPHINVDEFARRLRAPSRLSHVSESQCAPNTDKESIEPLDVRSSPQSHLKLGDGTSIVDSDDPRAVDDFRRWWQQGLPQGAAQDHFGGRKLTRMAIALAGIALFSSALGPTLKRPPVAPLANDTVRAVTAGTPADSSSKSPTGVSAATPVAPEVDPQAVDGLASKTSAQITDPEPARSESVRPDRALIASQVSSAAEGQSAANAPKPTAKPAQMNGVVGTTPPSFDLPAKRPGEHTARVAVSKTAAVIPSAAADTPSPPLLIGTLARPDDASGAKALQRLVESIVASAMPAEAPAAGSTGTVVQLGAPRSEAEAKRDLKRLNTRYGSALRGSPVGLRKVLVNGETVYRLHVVGLPRDKAAALCSRVKSDGGSCSIRE
jgi:SPOR domain